VLTDPRGRRQPLWWTLRRPVRPLTYHAAHRMFERAGEAAGSSATLHSLRHTAAYRMAEDPALPLTDVQTVLGHVLLTTTQIYLTPRKEEVIRRVLAHHAEQTRQAVDDYLRASGKKPGEFLFGGSRRLRQCMSTRQYARLVSDWIRSIGLDASSFGTHSLRRTKATLIYRRTGNLRAVQLLLGHTKIESTVRYLGIEVDDALAIAEQVDV